jgi:N-methylhydantoinase A/oxoprolinase/acetone carboxylase beta subunit
MTRLIGVDTGGTNTDVIVLDAAAGCMVSAKVPTTSADGVRLKRPGSGG